jgi:hypothetical protein
MTVSQAGNINCGFPDNLQPAIINFSPPLPKRLTGNELSDFS